ncbi:IclR family transcriptional regulator [Naasia lichenicola]|uniref:IclR family transcriptional regulator n=2 Tax=Naasia lichenicola TaxID=2565933 RepID=A0A4S4FLY0_9MICO|nr:IclR family transcriptional regulator [Naasia lichenicola]
MRGSQRSDVEERLVGADRVIAVLTELADHPLGVTLDELASTLKSSKSTVHRALATLRRAGLADLMGRGVYVLGDEYIRLALRNLGGRPETARVQPVLEALAARFGETAHYAVLSGTDIVYRAKMDPPQGAVRLTSVIGGRNPAHRTAVGKALLSTLVTQESQLVQRFGTSSFEPRTPYTITSTGALLAELEATRSRGFGVDDQENEVGINCVAIPVSVDGSGAATGAISISAVAFRCPLDRLVAAVPTIRAIIEEHLGPLPAIEAPAI